MDSEQIFVMNLQIMPKSIELSLIYVASLELNINEYDSKNTLEIQEFTKDKKERKKYHISRLFRWFD